MLYECRPAYAVTVKRLALALLGCSLVAPHSAFGVPHRFGLVFRDARTITLDWDAATAGRAVEFCNVDHVAARPIAARALNFGFKLNEKDLDDKQERKVVSATLGAKGPLAPGRCRKVTVRASGTVDPGSYTGVLSVTSGRVGHAHRAVTITVPEPEPKKVAEPEWSALLAFPVAVGGALFLLALTWRRWWIPRPSDKLREPLKYLDSSWTFKDSWISNVTVAGGLLTGIFGSSEVVEWLLGEDADRSVALATVGAACAVALIGAGPILLLATKTRKEPTPPKLEERVTRDDPVDPAAKSSITVGGLLVAAAITLGAAAGELWVVHRAATELDLGGREDWLPLAAVVAGLGLLVLYGCRTLLETLRAGTTKPAPPPPSDSVALARAIADALSKRQVDEDTVSGALEEAAKGRYPEVGAFLRTSPGDEYLPPRRSAMF